MSFSRFTVVPSLLLSQDELALESSGDKPQHFLRGSSLCSYDSPHLISAPSLHQESRLYIYIGGTGSSPTNQTTALHYQNITSPYYNTISLSYMWGNMTDMERNNKITQGQEQLEAYHSDICLGGNSSGLVDVPYYHSIVNRLERLLQNLSHTRPAEESWASFLSNDGKNIKFERIVMSGHSQGAGHVAFIAKRYPLLRVILLSGPQELLTYEDDEELSSRSWLQGSFSTRDVMAFMHCHEEGTADLIRENWQHINGLHSTTYPVSSTSILQSLLSPPLKLYLYAYTDIQDYWDVESPRNEVACSLEIRSAEAASSPSSSVSSPPSHIRTFFTAIEPNEKSPRNPRPNHNSTIADEFTPMLAMNSVDCLIHSTDSNNINIDSSLPNTPPTSLESIAVDLYAKDSNASVGISTSQSSEDIDVEEVDLIPQYRDNIWTHLLLSQL